MEKTEVSQRAIVRWGVADGQLTNGQRWMSLACLFFFALTTMYAMNRVTPVMSVYAMEYGLGPNVGYLMSAFAAAGVVVAFPGVWIMRNLGIKFSVVVTGVITIIGTALFTVATDPAMMYFARVLEGAGMGLIAVIGPNIMPRLFPVEKMGLVMGVWSAWSCPGILIATLIGPQLYMAFDLNAINVLGLVLESVATIWVIISCKMNAVPENELAVKEHAADEHTGSSRNYMLSAIIASLSFLAYSFIFGMFQGFYPTFLQTGMGWDIAASALPSTICTVVAIPINVIAGIFVAKYAKRKALAVAMYVLLAVVIGYFAWTTFAPAMPWIAGVTLGIVAGALPVSIRTLVPFLVTDTKKMDYVLGIMAFVTNLGALFSGPWGVLVSNVGYSNAGLYTLLPFGLLFVVLCTVFIKSDKKIIDEEARS